jgi:hypothetical protein
MLFINNYVRHPVVLMILLAWDLVWRGMALWKSAKKNQSTWFVFLLIVNSLGILPIIYLLIDKYSHKTTEETK